MRFLFTLFFALSLFQTSPAAWVRQRVTTFAWLHDIVFVSPDKGFIVGSDGTFLETGDGGSTWTKRRNFSDDALKQIWFSDEANGWILCERDIFSRGVKGSSYLLKTVDGGKIWERVEFNGAGRERITSFFFNRKGIGIAVGENGAVYEYDPDAAVWQRQMTPIRYLLLGGTFNDERNATMVGAGGNVFFSEDSGSTWSRANLGTKPAGKLNAVFFLNRTTGWIAGAGGVVLHSQNGGRSWRAQDTGVGSDLTDVLFLDSAEGYAVGVDGTVIHTTTAGNVWSVEQTGLKHRLERLAASGKKVFAVGFGGTILVTDRADAKRMQPKP